MQLPPPVLVGFLPKIVARKPKWLHSNTVERICSVSNCISKAPPGWIEKWQHSRMGFYDTPQLAQSVVPRGDTRYVLFAYKAYPLKFDDGRMVSMELPVTLRDAGLGGFEFIGYGAAARTCDNFDCSPLSCNSAAEDHRVNRHCLLDDREEAMALCLEAGRGTYEPGPYYLVEVYEEDGS